MPEIHLDLLNLNSLLLILLIIIIGGYLYYEIYHLKFTINDLQYTLNKQMNFINSENELTSDSAQELGNDLGMVVQLGQAVTLDMDQVDRDQVDIVDDQLADGWQAINEQMNDKDISRHSDDSDDSDDDRYEVSRADVENDYSERETKCSQVNIDEILEGKDIITDNSLSDILNVDDDLCKIDDFIATIKESEASKPPDYDKMTVSELKNILSDMSLPISGNKTKLIKRIKG